MLSLCRLFPSYINQQNPPQFAAPASSNHTLVALTRRLTDHLAEEAGVVHVVELVGAEAGRAAVERGRTEACVWHHLSRHDGLWRGAGTLACARKHRQSVRGPSTRQTRRYHRDSSSAILGTRPTFDMDRLI